MAKFKVGDRVRIQNPHQIDRGRYGKIVSAGVDGNPMLYEVDLGGYFQMQSESDLVAANAVRNAVIEKKLPPRGVGVYIEQQGGSFAVGPTDDGWSVANYGGEGVNFAHGFKTASEAKSWCASKGYKVEDVILANSLRSRNAVVQKALNAVARNGRAIPVDAKGKGIIERCKIRTADGDVAEVAHIDEDGFVYFKSKDGRVRGVSADTVTRLNADTSVLRETAVNSTRSTNAVVAKALNARAVCNAGDPGHFTSDELSALKGAFAGLNGASFSQYPNKSREQLAVRGENGILITVQKFAFDGEPVKFDIRGQGPRSGFGVKFASSIREAVTTVKRMLASAKRQSPYSFSKYD